MSTILKALRRLEEDGRSGHGASTQERSTGTATPGEPATDPTAHPPTPPVASEVSIGMPQAATELRDRILAEDSAAGAALDRKADLARPRRARLMVSLTLLMALLGVAGAAYTLLPRLREPAGVASAPPTKAHPEKLADTSASVRPPKRPASSSAASPNPSPPPLTQALEADPDRRPARAAMQARPTTARKASTATTTAMPVAATPKPTKAASPRRPTSPKSSPSRPRTVAGSAKPGSKGSSEAAPAPRPLRPAPKRVASRVTSSPSRPPAPPPPGPSPPGHRPRAAREESALADVSASGPAPRHPTPSDSSAAPSVAPSVERIDRRGLPDITVVRTAWHPNADRRSARIRLESSRETLTLREGDAIGGLVLQEISPSAVLFRSGDVEIRRRVGQPSRGD